MTDEGILLLSFPFVQALNPSELFADIVVETE